MIISKAKLFHNTCITTSFSLQIIYRFLLVSPLPEVHTHGYRELLVIDGEDVQDLHVDVHMDRGVGGGGLQLLVIQRKTEALHTLGHA